jgi:hypothetical protein
MEIGWQWLMGDGDAARPACPLPAFRHADFRAAYTGRRATVVSFAA